MDGVSVELGRILPQGGHYAVRVAAERSGSADVYVDVNADADRVLEDSSE
jgi:hypothetical protein